MQKPTKLFKKYQTLLKKDTLTEIEIITLKSRISGMKYSLTDNEVDQLTEQLTDLDCEYNITSEHAQKGIDYLKEKCFKRNGQPRRTKQVENMPVEFFEVIKDYSHFTFAGFEIIRMNPYTGNCFYMPIWCIHTRSGKTFDYCMGENLNFKAV